MQDVPLLSYNLHVFKAEFVALSVPTFMNRLISPLSRVAGLALTPVILAYSIVAQTAAERKALEESGGMGWTWILIVLTLLAGGGFLIWRRKQSANLQQLAVGNGDSGSYQNVDSYEVEGIDVDKDLEWLRKAKKRTRKRPATIGPKDSSSPELVSSPPVRNSLPSDLDTKAFQEKMRRLQYAQLPINSYTKLTASRIFDPLPISDDLSLLNAIEQANEEYEEDETVRELALKILTAFRSRNSVESLTQIALYDLSSNLRSKAVATLTDFDHPTVFEPILLACADPTREVRAAAARGLFRLSFDRADAWKRILETNDEFRMRHAARAAVESGIAVKSFERLVHEDLKVAYEAFSLVAFMIASGETDEIFKAIRDHRDERVKFALLHVLKVQKDERTHAKLEHLRTIKLSADVLERINDTLNSFERVMA